MFVELRNVKEIKDDLQYIYPSFVADVFKSGKKIGIFSRKNSPDGLPKIGFQASNITNNELMKTELFYSSPQPFEMKLDFLQPVTLKSTLRNHMIAKGLEAVIRERTMQFMERIATDQERNILLGNIHEGYSHFTMPSPIVEMLSEQKGYQDILDSLRSLKADLPAQATILNFNLPDQLLKEEGFNGRYFSKDLIESYHLRCQKESAKKTVNIDRKPDRNNKKP